MNVPVFFTVIHRMSKELHGIHTRRSVQIKTAALGISLFSAHSPWTNNFD